MAELHSPTETEPRSLRELAIAWRDTWATETSGPSNLAPMRGLALSPDAETFEQRQREAYNQVVHAGASHIATAALRGEQDPKSLIRQVEEEVGSAYPDGRVDTSVVRDIFAQTVTLLTTPESDTK